MLLIKSGHWYRSRLALERIRGLALVDTPHRDAEGYALLVCDLRGWMDQPRIRAGETVVDRVWYPHSLVIQADHGSDVQQATRAGGQPQIRRVEFALGPIGDDDRKAAPWLLDALEDLESFDHRGKEHTLPGRRRPPATS